ncbi:hypothetical protein [Lactiplantibacillus plantarum]|uniref:hypothetical protein n=1 Tax=Lactiplantibacillus plantarum TaxID=1590 RepID=UPI003B5086E4
MVGPKWGLPRLFYRSRCRLLALSGALIALWVAMRDKFIPTSSAGTARVVQIV